MALQNLNSVSDLVNLSPEDIDSIGKIYGEKFADKFNGIKTNQVRNVFSSIQSLRTQLKNKGEVTDEIRRDLILLKPKLAYSAGRQRAVKPFYELLSKAIDATKDSTDKVKSLNNFIALVETIVAYHKYNGGN